jgi:DNA-binding response OmpR family regulator
VLAFKNNSPDIVILDRDLPVITGSAVFSRIREISAATPVIILTGYDAPEDAAAYMKDGAASFLSKGDGLSNVLVEVERILGAPAAKAPSAPIERRKNPAAVPAAGGKKKGVILVADDDAMILNLLDRFLSSAGYEVLRALDGDTAVDMARERKPDILMLDIFMPGKDGLDVLKELRAEMPQTGFVMITGNDDEEVARTCLRMGAFDYISKPINLSSLENILKARLLLQKGNGAA